MNDLQETIGFLNELQREESNVHPLESNFYILAKEFHITKLDEYPLPYLLGLLKVYSKEVSKQEKELKKLSK